MGEARREAESPEPPNYRQKPIEVRAEFKTKHFRLEYHAYEDFHRSQWQSEPTSICFLIYRWFLAVFFNTGVLTGISCGFNQGRWFIYLTNWGFLLCGITSLFGAICMTIYHKNPQGMIERVCIIKCYWACYWSNLILAHVIAFVYWIFIHSGNTAVHDPGNVSFTYNIWTHAMPSILFTMDHMLVAQPARLLHFIYPFILALIYGIFTIIYYLLGGLDVRGRNYIYEYLDHSQPHRSFGTMLMVTILLIVCSILHYGLYRLRVFIAGKLKKLL